MDFIREVFNALKYLILFAINSVIVIYLFEHFFPIDEHLILAIEPMTAMAIGQTIGQIGVSLYQGFKSKQQTEKGEQDLIDAEKAQADAISAMRAVEIQNKLEALQVPTLGAEVRERAITRALGTGVEAAQEGGPEAIIGGLPRMQAQADVASAQIAGDLDTLEAQRDRAVLAQDQAIEMERKQRELDIQNMILGGAGLAAADAQRLQQMGQYGQMQALGGIVTAGVAALNPYGMQPKETAVDTTAITEVATPRAAQAINVQTEPSLRMPVRDTAGITTGATPTGSMVGGIYNPYANYNSSSSPAQLTVPQGYNPNALPGSTVGGMYNPYTSLNTGAMVGGIYNPYANYSAFSTPVNQ